MGPFPIPKTFECPYCGSTALQGEFKPSDGRCHFSHEVNEKVKVGFYYYVTLVTIHQFEILWVDGTWQSWKGCTGSHQMCERVELSNGKTTNWHRYNTD